MSWIAGFKEKDSVASPSLWESKNADTHFDVHSAALISPLMVGIKCGKSCGINSDRECK